MIGTVECRVTAHRPNQPLSPIFTYVGSPSNMRIIDVPKGIGQFKVDVVKVVVDYPNNKKEIVEAVRQGSVYVATIPSCEIAGKTTGGVEIICDCIDENGNPVEGFVIGKGDVFVLERDSKFSKLVEKSYVKYVDELPTTPAKGDIVYHNSTLQMFDGTQWLKFGDKEAIDELAERVEEVRDSIPTKTSELENDSGFITKDEVDATKITSEDGNQYINGEGEVYVKGGGKDYTPWVAKYVEYGTEIDEMTFFHMGDDDGGYWLGTYRSTPIITQPSNIPGNAHALELNFKWNDDGQWFDIKATREEVESEWTKKGDLALEGDVAEIDAKATNALTIANNLSEDIWGADGLSVKVEGLEQTKANVTETENIRTDLNQAFDYIAELQQDKITSPTTQMEVGKVLTVVEVEDEPVARGASLQSVSPRATSTHLEWAAVDPITKTSQLENDSGFITQDEVDLSDVIKYDDDEHMTAHLGLEGHPFQMTLAHSTQDSGKIVFDENAFIDGNHFTFVNKDTYLQLGGNLHNGYVDIGPNIHINGSTEEGKSNIMIDGKWMVIQTPPETKEGQTLQAVKVYDGASSRATTQDAEPPSHIEWEAVDAISKTSQLENDSGYITIEDVPEQSTTTFRTWED